MNSPTKAFRHTVEQLHFTRIPKPLHYLFWPDLADCTRMIEKFEAINDPQLSSTSHHEEGHRLQLKLQKDVLSFLNVVEQMDNPFLTTSQEFIELDTQMIIEHAVATSLSQIREAGQTLHAAYVTERLEKAAVSISDRIKRNNILTFASRPDPKKKGLTHTGVQRQNMRLITQFFLSIQSRPDADVADFFQKSERTTEPG